METNIKKCSCEHVFQDVKYGIGQRLYNKCVKGWRCSVCGNTTISSPTPLKKD